MFRFSHFEKGPGKRVETGLSFAVKHQVVIPGQNGPLPLP
jgi:hypothetical protein